MKLSLYIFGSAFSESVETRVNDGLIVGNRDYYQGKSVDEYLGIPFAQPPVESLRFKSPQKPTPWTVLETQKKKPLCAQPDSWGLPQSEDCLYLDVYTSSESYETDAKPVLVWIHGGSFTGDWHPDWYTGKYLCPTADVVLVVLNYRLGALGFLSTQDNVISGNMGVRDQNMALEWVHDNIGSFGGDPDNVTIFGQSAGAISVKFQAISPMSGTIENPLFKRVGVVSGQLMTWNPEPLEVAQSFAQHTRCLADFNISSRRFLECLKTKTTEELVAASDRENVAQFLWTPVIDGEFLLDPPTKENMGKPGRLDRFEHFQTCTTGEIAMGAASIRNRESFERLLKPVFSATIPVDVENSEFWRELEETYLENGDPESATTDMWRNAYIFVGMDTAYVRYIVQYGWALEQTSTPFHLANFRFNPSENLQDPVRVPGEWNEPWHGDDLMFYFGWPMQSGNGTESDIEMSHQMMSVLGSFARGEPAVPTGEVWPETRPGMSAMIIDGPNDYTLEPDFRRRQMLLWEDLLYKYPSN